MKRNIDSIAPIIEAAAALRKLRECDWHDYEKFKRQIANAVGYGPEYDRAIDQLCEALDL